MTQPPVATAVTTEKSANGVGLAALIVGAVALLFAIIPVISFIAWLPALTAIVLGIVGLVLKGRKRLFAWLGIALGALAWIIAIAVSIASLAGLAGAIDDAASSNAPPAVEETSAAPAEPAEPETTEAPAADVPADYANALIQAQQYSDLAHLSKAGLYDQLVSPNGGQFSAEAAQYAIDNLQVDYAQNALEQARQYQDTMAMSPEAIRDQLTSDAGGKFTQEEADHAIANLNS